MPYILAGQTELKRGSWGGAIRVPDIPWDIYQGDSIAHYFLFGFNRYLPPNSKHELTNILQQQIPKKITYPIVNSQVPDICGVGGGELLFSQRVKNKLDELEPGAHDFFPVLVEDPTTGERIEGHYLAYVWQRPDIIDHGNSLIGGPKIETGLVWARSCGFMLRRFYEKDIKDIFDAYRYLVNFKHPGYEGRHFWRGTVGEENTVEKYNKKTGKRMYPDPLANKIFVSDQFAQWMKAEKITGTRPIQVYEKTVDWYREQREKGFVS